MVLTWGEAWDVGAFLPDVDAEPSPVLYHVTGYIADVAIFPAFHDVVFLVGSLHGVQGSAGIIGELVYPGRGIEDIGSVADLDLGDVLSGIENGIRSVGNFWYPVS